MTVTVISPPNLAECECKGEHLADLLVDLDQGSKPESLQTCRCHCCEWAWEALGTADEDLTAIFPCPCGCDRWLDASNLDLNIFSEDIRAFQKIVALSTTNGCVAEACPQLIER